MADLTTAHPSRPGQLIRQRRVPVHHRQPLPGLRAGQPCGAPQGFRLRVPALLPAKPQAVPAPGRHRSRALPSRWWPARCRPPNRRPQLPCLPRRKTGGPANRHLVLLAGRPRGVPARLQLHLRARHCWSTSIPVRHIEENVTVPMYITNRECTPAGSFSGPLVVTMRPVPSSQVVRAVQVTSRFPGRTRGAGAHRRPGRTWHKRPLEAPFRRPRDRQARRGAGLLGLRRHSAGGRDALPARIDDHPYPGADVRHHPEGRAAGGTVREEGARVRRAETAAGAAGGRRGRDGRPGGRAERGDEHTGPGAGARRVAARVPGVSGRRFQPTALSCVLRPRSGLPTTPSHRGSSRWPPAPLDTSGPRARG